jgi:hypothetical protein
MMFVCSYFFAAEMVDWRAKDYETNFTKELCDAPQEELIRLYNGTQSAIQSVTTQKPPYGSVDYPIWRDFLDRLYKNLALIKTEMQTRELNGHISRR